MADTSLRKIRNEHALSRAGWEGFTFTPRMSYPRVYTRAHSGGETADYPQNYGLHERRTRPHLPAHDRQVSSLRRQLDALKPRPAGSERRLGSGALRSALKGRNGQDEQPLRGAHHL